MFDFAHTQSTLRDAITRAYRTPEQKAVLSLTQSFHLTDAQNERIKTLATDLIKQVRKERGRASGVDALMHEFSLSSDEGVALMCLAEALLRVPDNATRDRLIKDKLSDGDWKRHIGNSPSMFVNAAAWGLLLTGNLSKPTSDKGLSSALNRVLAKGGEPFIRGGVNYAMKLLGKQFVTGQTIDEALANGKSREKMGYRFSFDMLGEAAMTQKDADRYYNDYVNAIHAIGKDNQERGVYDGNGISVKLSAIHPRYYRAQHKRVMEELTPKLKALFLLAKDYNIGLNIDAEEAHRLELSLDLMEKIVSDADLKGFNGIGFVVQAYQKRCPFVIDFLADLAKRHNQRLMVRLVKGAYWDSEIKWAQVDGLLGYPVYTQKVHTDVSYLVCAKKLFEHQETIYPQFATHNAQSLATIYEMGEGLDYEFQCLHGMGETLYDQVVGDDRLGRRVRIYAPVGTHETLLAYLVRRLLENGANSSFVNQIVDENVSIDELTCSPFDKVKHTQGLPNPAIAHPRHLFDSGRQNSKGLDLSNEHLLQRLQEDLNQACDINFDICSLTASDFQQQAPVDVINPANHSDTVASVRFAKAEDMPAVISDAINAQHAWQAKDPAARATIIRQFADLLEDERRMALLLMVCVREAGKTLNNAIAEVREAVDFCRYYADECERLGLSSPIGTVVAISPWNFPLAIFVGQVVASLCAGNTVVAKPAEQTTLIAYLAVSWLYEAGIPKEVLQLVLGAGDVGAALVADERINGVVFTGSTDVAKKINTQLLARDNAPTLIAETGGMNAMIVDSTALPEQVCGDVLASAFDSAGQRCSALRILCLQENIADGMLTMIKKAMNELQVADPTHLATDVGPVIDQEAKNNLTTHINKLKQHVPYHEIKAVDGDQGTFVAPILFELDDLSQLKQEVFGPVLHVIRYKAANLPQLIEEINSKGYALTHGIHSRIDATVNFIGKHINAGNIYINRNIVGAVVGVQPFGGHGLSGTGPKAGGPFYLQRLSCVEQWHLPQALQRQQGNEQALADVLGVAGRSDLGEEQLAYLKTHFDTLTTKVLNGASVVLDGPTGEHNSLYYHAPKSVWLYGGDLLTALMALGELALNGTHCMVLEQSPLAVWAPHLSPYLSAITPSVAKDNTLIVALTPLPAEQKQALGRLDGAIRRVIDVNGHLDMAKLCLETSYSNNTTAAGGNASLMTSS